MNGYQVMADSYRKFAKTGDVSREDALKEVVEQDYLEHAIFYGEGH